jgi:ubiquinone/menaquinone biosynthesis C-methylase UbiE
MKMGKLEKLFVNSDGHSRSVSQHAEKLLQYTQVRPGQHLLDVGTGNGAVPIHLAKQYGLDVTGVDIDQAQIDRAKANSLGMDGVQFLTLDGTRLPFADGEFEVAITNKVTHHIPNWQEVVEEMVRVVKPGGYLIYSDLVYPQALATVGASIASSRAGFPTYKTLKALLVWHKMAPIYESKVPLHFEGVYQKPVHM